LQDLKFLSKFFLELQIVDAYTVYLQYTTVFVLISCEIRAKGKPTDAQRQ